MREKIIASVLVIIALIALARSYNLLPTNLLGFGSLVGFNVSVQGKLDGKLLLSYQPWLQIGSSQNIYAEFVNIGAYSVTARIEERIYSYVNGSLVPLAYYYDSQIFLPEGFRRGFSTVFLPSSTGLYYIQARATYNDKVIETWGAFPVFYPPTTTITIYSPTVTAISGGAGGGATVSPLVSTPQVNFSYPEKVQLFKGSSTLINITVKNTGGVALHNLKLYVSTTNSINFVINPKQVSSLTVGDTTVFLIFINTPSNAPEGSYSFDFELNSDEITEGRSILLEVLSSPASLEDELQHSILNSELLISEIEREILSASLKGFNVDMASQSLNAAKTNLENAKKYFELKDFNQTEKELNILNINVQDAVLQLASSAMFIYKAPTLSLSLILLMIIIFVIAFALIYLYWKEKKEKRPKLLKELSETT